MASALDHLVVNTRFDTDAAQALFEALGFTLTPRGRHTLGSINHLMVFERGFLELIGLPLDTEVLRQEVLNSPIGIDGLVLATTDADATRDAMVAAGFEMQPVQSFSRPVDIAGEVLQARFRTARLQPGQVAAGRIYFCEHGTPELVWRPEWMTHANGVVGMAELVVVGARPEASAKQYAALGPLGDDFSITCLTPRDFANRYGALASHAPSRDDFFGAIRLRAEQPAEIGRRAAACGLPVAQGDDRVVFALPAFETLIECTP